MSFRRIPLAVLLLSGTMLLGQPSSAAPASGDIHCAVVVTGQAADGELLTSLLGCSTEAPVAVQSAQATGEVTAAASFIIGIHFTGSGFTGSSLTVYGADCNGGWINLTGSFYNNVESTINGCYRVKHFDYSYVGGSYESTWGGGGTLTYMLNRAQSISYHTS